jgi:hypothetical protein
LLEIVLHPSKTNMQHRITKHHYMIDCNNEMVSHGIFISAVPDAHGLWVICI